MGNVDQIVNKRATPGVLIIDGTETLLHCNSEALAILASMGYLTGKGEEPRVPQEIAALCQALQEGDPQPKSVQGGLPSHRKQDRERQGFGVRAFFIDNPGVAGEGARSIMVLIERVVEKHEVDVERAKQVYGLSRREGEVLRHICRGLSNREIAGSMFICEYTVKDHIKQIMKRMKVKSRSGIAALLR